jgi:hypothetical protein
MRYDLGFYIPEDGILHSQRRQNLKSYVINRVIYLRHCTEVPETNSSLDTKQQTNNKTNSVALSP